MEIHTNKYVFTNNDADALQIMGYELAGGEVDVLVNFMHQCFPNFNLLSLMRAVEENFSVTTTAKIHRRILFDVRSQSLEIEFANDFENESDALLFIRRLVNDAGLISIYHKYCVLPLDSRGKGKIKPVFQESLRQYLNMSADRILVHAGLSGGGYVWAKHGFVATDKREMEMILADAKTKLSSVELRIAEKIYDTYYTRHPDGRAFPIELWAALDSMKPILAGSDWHGELDLKNEEQLHNFIDYVFRES